MNNLYTQRGDSSRGRRPAQFTSAASIAARENLLSQRGTNQQTNKLPTNIDTPAFIRRGLAKKIRAAVDNA